MIWVVVNPVAGRGFAGRAGEAFARWLNARGVAYTLEFTRRAGHAAELAALAALEGAASVWAVGGDATLREAAIGLMGAGVPLGLLPCGTGNDFCRTLGLPARDPVAAYLAQQGPPRELDMWMANEHPFINVAGVGFDVETLRQARRFRALPGSMPPYFMGVLMTILTHRNLHMRVEMNGKTYEAPKLLLSAANGRYIGGGMAVAPDAETDDGLLDIVAVDPVSRPRILPILPKFLKGAHIRLPITKVERAREIKIAFDKETGFQADGEIFTARSLHIRPADHRLLLMGMSARP